MASKQAIMVVLVVAMFSIVVFTAWLATIMFINIVEEETKAEIENKTVHEALRSVVESSFMFVRLIVTSIYVSIIVVFVIAVWVEVYISYKIRGW